VVDIGCSCSVSSLRAADLLQLDQLEEEGNFWNEVLPSDKKSGFAKGLNHKCEFQVTQEFAYGLLAGECISLQILDQPGNSTAPLISINDLASMGAILDLANSTISIRGRPPTRLPRSKTGLTIIPVTRLAVERWDKRMAAEDDALIANIEEAPASVGAEQSQPEALLCENAPESCVQGISDPVKNPLTRKQRNILQSQISDLRRESSQALLSVKDPRSKTSVLACPALWKARDNMTQVSHKNAKAMRGKHRPHLRWLAEELRPPRYI